MLFSWSQGIIHPGSHNHHKTTDTLRLHALTIILQHNTYLQLGLFQSSVIFLQCHVQCCAQHICTQSTHVPHLVGKYWELGLQKHAYSLWSILEIATGNMNDNEFDQITTVATHCTYIWQTHM